MISYLNPVDSARNSDNPEAVLSEQLGRCGPDARAGPGYNRHSSSPAVHLQASGARAIDLLQLQKLFLSFLSACLVFYQWR